MEDFRHYTNDPQFSIGGRECQGRRHFGPPGLLRMKKRFRFGFGDLAAPTFVHGVGSDSFETRDLF